MAIPESLVNDPDYSFRIEGLKYEGAGNVRLLLRGASRGMSLTFNTHLDVVPPSPGQENAFRPQHKENFVFGRGACDAKGQVATLCLVLKTLHDLRLRPGGDITFDFVVEEEPGGNGTLWVVKSGLSADGAVVLEPTSLQVCHLVRGAVWFEVETKGKAGHSGSPGSTVSALKEAIKVMDAFEKVREDILKISRAKIPKIAAHPNPMPCNFGVLQAGTWPAAAPSQAVLKGVFGFLPPFKRQDIQKMLRQAVAPFPAAIKFNMLNSDPSYIPEDHKLVQILLAAAAEAGIDAKPGFMNASCDSWRYTEQLGIPAVVFGGGSIASAHAVDESISIDDIRRAALTLINFIEKWSGLHER
jgi:acetylornithine deacetylase